MSKPLAYARGSVPVSKPLAYARGSVLVRSRFRAATVRERMCTYLTTIRNPSETPPAKPFPFDELGSPTVL